MGRITIESLAYTAISITDDALSAISNALVHQPRLARLKLEQYDESRQVPAVAALLKAKPHLIFSTG